MKHRRLLAAALAVAVLVVVGAAAAWYFLRPAPSDARLSLDGPPEGSLVTPGTTIHGQAFGPGQVRVWVEGINFAVPAVREGDTWTYTYQGGLSGQLTLAFALQDEAWGRTLRVDYEFQGESGADAGERASDHFPEVLRSIIRPVESALRSVVVLINEGVSRAPQLTGGASHDLDGNGVPDYAQGSPVAPPQGLPYGWIAVTVIVALLCGSVVLLVKADTWTAYFVRRRHLRNAAVASRAHLQAQQAREAQHIKLKALQVQAVLRQTLIREQAALRAKVLGVQAERARGEAKLAGQRVEGILGLRRAQLEVQGPSPPRRGFWARLRGR